MRPNTVLRAWRAGKRTIGAWLGTPSGHIAEVMSHTGFDWLCIDMQHGVVDYADTVEMLRAISTTETVPVRARTVERPADADEGARRRRIRRGRPARQQSREGQTRGLGVPLPAGRRSLVRPVRAAMYGGDGYVVEANDEIAVICMIETREALDNLDEILAVGGVDCAYIGPSDLAYAVGLAPIGDNPEPKHQETVLSR